MSNDVLTWYVQYVGLCNNSIKRTLLITKNLLQFYYSSVFIYLSGTYTVGPIFQPIL